MEDTGEATALLPLDGLRGRSMLWIARSCWRGFSRYTEEREVLREGVVAPELFDACGSEVLVSYMD